MPSSVKFGSRWRIDLMRSYSSGVRPCLAMRSGVMAGSAVIEKLGERPHGGGSGRPLIRVQRTERSQDGLEDDTAIGAAEEGIAGALGMRHEAEDIAPFVDDAGDALDGAVWIGGIDRRTARADVAQEHAALGIELAKGRGVSHVAAFSVRDGNVQRRTGAAKVQE